MKEYNTDQTPEKKLEQEIAYMLEERVQPSVAMHGGRVELKRMDHDNKIVTVYMSGACAGCSMSQMTLKSGVENLLVHYFPDNIQSVEAEFGEIVNPYA
jgi:Fe-S cluster biogenesis protein NfuA